MGVCVCACVCVCVCVYMCASVLLTDGDVGGAVCLQEAVEVVPHARHPVDDLHQLQVARAAADLRLDQLPAQEAAQEAFHRLQVVGTQHPPEDHTGEGGSGTHEAVPTLNERTNAVNERTNTVNERTNGVNERTNAANERTNAVNERTNAVNERTNAVNERTSS